MLSDKSSTYFILIFLTTLLTGCGGAESTMSYNNNGSILGSNDNRGDKIDSNSTNSKLFAGAGGGNAKFVASSIVENIKLISLPGDTDPITGTPSLIGYLNHLLITLAQAPSGAWDSVDTYTKSCSSNNPNELKFQRLISSNPEQNRYEITVSNCTFGPAVISGTLSISNLSALEVSPSLNAWSIQTDIAIHKLDLNYNNVMVTFIDRDPSTNQISPPLRFSSQKNGLTGDINASIQLQTSINQDGYLTILLPNGQAGSELETNRILNESNDALSSITSSYISSNGSHALNILNTRVESYTGDGSRYGVYNLSPIQWLDGFKPPASGTIKIIGGDKTNAAIKITDGGLVSLFIYENNDELVEEQLGCLSTPYTWDNLPLLRNTLCQSGNSNNTQNGNPV